MATVASIHLVGLASARSAASAANNGYFYLETDTAGGTLWRSNGSTWVQAAFGVTAVPSTATDADTVDGEHAAAFAASAHTHGYIPLPAAPEKGSVLYFDSSNWIELVHGTAGQALLTGGHNAAPSWDAPVPASHTHGYIVLPGSPEQGDVLYWNGSAWTVLHHGTAGQVLASGGDSANPAWADAAVGGIPPPATPEQGDVLYYSGAAWVVLTHGDAGKYLKSGGHAANPSWDTPTAAAPKLDDCAAPDDNTDLDASTTAHGLLLKTVAPAAGLRSVVGVDNGETTYALKALFDATNPAALGSAAPGSAMTAARRDHVHDTPATPALYTRGAFVFVIPGTLAATAGQGPILYVVQACVIEGVYLNVKTAPTGANLTIDVHKNGTTIFTTQSNRPVVVAGQVAGNSTTIEVSSLAAGDLLTLDVDVIGSTIAGADLTVTVKVKQTVQTS